MDPYDQLYPETGSSNISKAAPEWKEKLDQARAAGNSDTPVLHQAYALVNAAVAAGEAWSKCMNCGSPYRMGEPGRHTTHSLCSEACRVEFEVGLTRQNW